MIDNIYLINSMLLEVINILLDPFDLKKTANKTLFKKFLEFYEKNQYFTEPDTNKEIVLAATKELLKGKWSNCYNYLI